MTKYQDKRGLPVCCKTAEGAILLDDETAEAYAAGDYPTVCLTLPRFDVELQIYRITHKSGARLPSAPAERETLRAIIRAALKDLWHQPSAGKPTPNMDHEIALGEIHAGLCLERSRSMVKPGPNIAAPGHCATQPDERPG